MSLRPLVCQFILPFKSVNLVFQFSHIKKGEDHPVAAGLESKGNRGLSETDIFWSNGNVECTNITTLFY